MNMKRTVVLSLAAAALFGAATFFSPSGAEAARKPRQPVASSVVLDQAAPHLGDWITFSFVVPDTVKSPRIQVMCSQDGVVVFGAADAATASFELGGGSSPWRTNGGAADCVATLYEWDWRPVQTFVPYAQVAFSAGDRR